MMKKYRADDRKSEDAAPIKLFLISERAFDESPAQIGKEKRRKSQQEKETLTGFCETQVTCKNVEREMPQVGAVTDQANRNERLGAEQSTNHCLWR